MKCGRKKVHQLITVKISRELVCSNSLRSNDTNNAVGLLKQEMRELDSLIMRSADANQVPAGSALAVDREAFSKQITDFIKAMSW